MCTGHSQDFIIIKTNVYVHIHNVFVSNELISVTILFQNTDFPFRLSPLIFLSRDRSTFSPTIITLSASILHIPISFFFCIAYFSFHFTYTTCLQIKFHSLPCSPSKELLFPEQCTVCVTVHSITSEKCL